LNKRYSLWPWTKRKRSGCVAQTKSRATALIFQNNFDLDCKYCDRRDSNSCWM